MLLQIQLSMRVSGVQKQKQKEVKPSKATVMVFLELRSKYRYRILYSFTVSLLVFVGFTGKMCILQKSLYFCCLKCAIGGLFQRIPQSILSV